MFVLETTQPNDKLFVLHDFNFLQYDVGRWNAGSVYESKMDSTFQNMHGAVAGTSPSTKAVYLLSSSQTVYKQMRVSKVKMDFPSTRRMATQAAWENNSDYNMKVFGRLGVISSGSTDTVFAAASQSYG